LGHIKWFFGEHSTQWATLRTANQEPVFLTESQSEASNFNSEPIRSQLILTESQSEASILIENVSKKIR